MAKLFADAGVVAITAFISPYRADRDQVRALVPAGDFVEVLVDCPLDVCERRDVKGLYAKARAGQIPEFTGISAPYEAPLKPELTLQTATQSVEQSVAQILGYLEGRGVVPRAVARRAAVSRVFRAAPSPPGRATSPARPNCTAGAFDVASRIATMPCGTFSRQSSCQRLRLRAPIFGAALVPARADADHEEARRLLVAVGALDAPRGRASAPPSRRRRWTRARPGVRAPARRAGRRSPAAARRPECSSARGRLLRVQRLHALVERLLLGLRGLARGLGRRVRGNRELVQREVLALADGLRLLLLGDAGHLAGLTLGDRLAGEARRDVPDLRRSCAARSPSGRPAPRSP